jgi:hypothetical protein
MQIATDYSFLSLGMGHWHLTQIVSSYSYDAGVGREGDRYSQVSPDMFTYSCDADDSDNEMYKAK